MEAIVRRMERLILHPESKSSTPMLEVKNSSTLMVSFILVIGKQLIQKLRSLMNGSLKMSTIPCVRDRAISRSIKNEF